jgi:hypothetical protein
VTESASQVPENATSKVADGKERPTETFLQVSIRRSRYLVAIAIAAAIFLTVGWMVVRPPVGAEGISLVEHSGAVGAVVLLVLGAIATAVATPICKLDSPHAGMWCAFLGLGGLAIRGGNIGELLRKAQMAGEMREFYRGLAAECVYWIVIVAGCDIVGRLVWNKFCVNHWWLSRGGVDVDVLHKGKNIGAGLPGKKTDASIKSMLIESAIAFAITGAVAYFLMPVFLQSQAKGQVLFGAFVIFGFGAFLARLFSPAADPLAYWIAIPAAAAVGYWMSAKNIAIANPSMLVDAKAIAPDARIYPAISVTAAGRALPIDFVSGGVAGAIMGYYIALRVHLNHVMDRAVKKDGAK